MAKPIVVCSHCNYTGEKAFDSKCPGCNKPFSARTAQQDSRSGNRTYAMSKSKQDSSRVINAGEETMNCRQCDTAIEEGHAFCTQCGTTVKEDTRTCAFCELEMHESIATCPRCGTDVSEEDAVIQSFGIDTNDAGNPSPGGPMPDFDHPLVCLACGRPMAESCDTCGYRHVATDEDMSWSEVGCDRDTYQEAIDWSAFALNMDEAQIRSLANYLVYGPDVTEITKEELASKPPKWLHSAMHEVWADVVMKGNHTTYGGAVNHFKRRVDKMHREYGGKTQEEFEYGDDDETPSDSEELE